MGPDALTPNLELTESLIGCPWRLQEKEIFDLARRCLAQYTNLPETVLQHRLIDILLSGYESTVKSLVRAGEIHSSEGNVGDLGDEGEDKRKRRELELYAFLVQWIVSLLEASPTTSKVSHARRPLSPPSFLEHRPFIIFSFSLSSFLPLPLGMVETYLLEKTKRHQSSSQPGWATSLSYPCSVTEYPPGYSSTPFAQPLPLWTRAGRPCPSHHQGHLPYPGAPYLPEKPQDHSQGI